MFCCPVVKEVYDGIGPWKSIAYVPTVLLFQALNYCFCDQLSDLSFFSHIKALQS